MLSEPPEDETGTMLRQSSGTGLSKLVFKGQLVKPKIGGEIGTLRLMGIKAANSL